MGLARIIATRVTDKNIGMLVMRRKINPLPPPNANPTNNPSPWRPDAVMSMNVAKKFQSVLANRSIGDLMRLLVRTLLKNFNPSKQTVQFSHKKWPENSGHHRRRGQRRRRRRATHKRPENFAGHQRRRHRGRRRRRGGGAVAGWRRAVAEHVGRATCITGYKSLMSWCPCAAPGGRRLGQWGLPRQPHRNPQHTPLPIYAN